MSVIRPGAFGPVTSALDEKGGRRSGWIVFPPLSSRTVGLWEMLQSHWRKGADDRKFPPEMTGPKLEIMTSFGLAAL